MERMEREKPILKIEGVSKEYRLGSVGAKTFKEELTALFAKWRGKEDSVGRIGESREKRGSRFSALDNVSFDIYRGDRIGIIGRNGAGKSTLLKIISQITSPTSGEIGINGRVASLLEVGTGFHSELTGRENIYLNGSILGMSKNEIESKIDEIIAFSEVGEFIDTPIKRYSSGMTVKLAFSVAVHLDAEVLIMDEVLAVGDVEFQKKCIAKMNEISRSQNRTILYVSHNMATVRSLCNRCVVLDGGKLIYDGDVEGAISYYVGTVGLSGTKITYGSKNHSTFGVDHKVRIDTLEFPDLSLAAFPYNGEIKAVIGFTAFDELENLLFRLPVYSDSGMKIGTLQSSSVPSVKPGEYKATLTFSLNALLPGRYSFWIVARSGKMTDFFLDHDVITDAMAFEIIPPEDGSVLPGEDFAKSGPVRFPEAPTTCVNKKTD